MKNCRIPDQLALSQAIVAGSYTTDVRMLLQQYETGKIGFDHLVRQVESLSTRFRNRRSVPFSPGSRSRPVYEGEFNS